MGSLSGYRPRLRGINGVFHAVSPKHLQQYIDEYSFRYNHQDSTTPMFRLMLRRVGAV